MQPFWHNLFRQLQEMEDAGPAPNIVLTRGAVIASWLYGLGAGWRRTLYTRGWLRTKRLPAPVISVGNLTVGGTGKTPVVAYLAGLWRDRGRRVVILSRGYGGQTQVPTRISDGEHLYHKPPEVGEEPYWLARTLPGVVVYTGARRYETGMAAWKEFKPDLFLLDDGFQHVQLHRDLDLVLLDAASPFGNGYLLPRGPLREPISVLKTAQILVLTRFDCQYHLENLTAFQKRFSAQTILTMTISPVRVTSHPAEHAEAPETIRHRPLMAFAGLARPGVFTETLQDLGAQLLGFRPFPDHHPYDSQELHELATAARARGAEALITTGKDWARLGERWDEEIPLWVLDIEARLSDPELILSFLER